MLDIDTDPFELFDETDNSFITVKSHHLKLEHSLISLSKWEAKYHKPFIGQKKTRSEKLDYIKFMTINPNVDSMVYSNLSERVLSEIDEYIENPMTATTINDNDSTTNNEIITSEIVYYWMIELGIPFECEKWHINRLLMLINVCSIKRSPKKKMSRRDILNRNRELNEARKAKLNTKG